MNYKSKIAFLLLFIVVVVACRKDWQKTTEENTNTFLTEAKSYYYQQLKISAKTSSTKQLNAQSLAISTALGKLTPLWYKNYASNTKANQFLEVPLINSQKQVVLYNFAKKPTSEQINIARAKASFQRVLIYKTKRNRFHQVLLTYVPDYDYLQKSNFNAGRNQINKMDESFNGYILFSSLKTGQHIQLLQFEKGKMIKKRYVNALAKGFIKSAQQQNVKGGTQTMGWEQQCEPIYMTPCYEVGDPPVETCHEPIQVGEDCWTVWVDDPEEEPEPEDPCEDPANFWFCDPDNPDPNNPEEPEQPEPPLDTANNILDSCIKAGVEKAFEVDIKNDFKDIMNGTFLENDNILLTIKDQAIPDTSMLGYFDPFQTVLIDSNYVRHGTIYLNSNVLSTSAQEMVVVTMYHELLHAYLGTLSGLYGGPALNHQYMATTFVSKLSNALQGIFPNLSNADATALAWMGLHGTPMWGLKTTAEQNAILSTMNKYKKGTSGTKCK